VQSGCGKARNSLERMYCCHAGVVRTYQAVKQALVWQNRECCLLMCTDRLSEVCYGHAGAVSTYQVVEHDWECYS